MNLWFDLKYAWRLLLKTPGHSVLCVLIVAISVGLSIGVYSVVYNMAFKPLSFDGSDRWYTVLVRSRAMRGDIQTLDAYTYQEIIKRRRIVHHLGAMRMSGSVLSEGQSSVNLAAGFVSPSLLSETRVAPHLGRVFNAADAQIGSAVAILSYETWQTHFSGDHKVVGRSTRIDATPTLIVGVMPAEFSLITKANVWLPLRPESVTQPTPSMADVAPLVRLDAGQTLASLQEELRAIVNEVTERYPAHYREAREIDLVPAHRGVFDYGMPILWIEMTMAVCVVLLGCVNIGTLFFARMLERSRELAIRNALGSSRGRLIGQCLAESSLVALLGLGLGVALGALIINIFQMALEIQFRSVNSPMSFRFTFALREVLFAVGVAAFIWLLSSVAPALRISTQDAAMVLSGSGKGTANRRGSRGTHVLVGIQVVISCFLLVVCGTVVTELRNLANGSYGVDSTGVTVAVHPSRFGQSRSKQADRLLYMEELAIAIRGRLANAEIAYASVLPGASRTDLFHVLLENQAANNQDLPLLPVASVSNEYFRTLGIATRSGRLFAPTDNSASLAVAVLDENLAKRYWPNQDPLGKRFQLNPSDSGPWLTVIGIVANVRRNSANQNREGGTIYRPIDQSVPESIHPIVKSADSTGRVRRALTEVAFVVDRDMPLGNMQTLDEYLRGMDSVTEIGSSFFTAIALLASFLAATGVFGVISRGVAQRTQEIGVRRALGASNWQIISVFLSQGSVYLLVGVVVGGGLGIISITLLSAVMLTLMEHVAAVALGVVVGSTLVVFVSSYFPTRRAVSLEPGDALRYE